MLTVCFHQITSIETSHTHSTWIWLSVLILCNRFVLQVYNCGAEAKLVQLLDTLSQLVVNSRDSFVGHDRDLWRYGINNCYRRLVQSVYSDMSM